MTKDYYSTKRVTAWTEARDGVPGKAIKYQDGYTSWCPLDVFERDYQPIDAMSFGHALRALKAGHLVARAGWNGKGMWLVLVPGSDVTTREGTPYGKALCANYDVTINPHIDMHTATGEMQPGWLASQTDMLADDWMIVAGL